VFGLFIVILGAVMPDELPMVIFGLVFVIPGAWWIISDRRDQKQWDRYEETVENNRRLASMIGDDNPDIVAGMGVVDPPSKRSRHWGIVSIVMVVLFAGFVVLAPKQETTSGENPDDERVADYIFDGENKQDIDNAHHRELLVIHHHDYAVTGADRDEHRNSGTYRGGGAASCGLAATTRTGGGSADFDC